jgi:ABC-type transport system substrate-binding protein
MSTHGAASLLLHVFLFSSIGCVQDREVVHTVTPQPTYGGILRLAAQVPESLDPIHSRYYWESEIVLQIFDGLLRFDQNLNIAPALARDWQVSSNGTVYTFHLRQDAHFHNGRNVIAEDFVYSITRLLNPKARSEDAEHYSEILGAKEYRDGTAPSIKGLKALDSFTLQITLERTYAPFLRVLAQQSASVVPREEVDRPNIVFGRRPVGTGAFRFQEWDSSGEIVLSANPNYFEGRPYLDSVRIRTLSDLNPQKTFQDFLDGQLDISYVPNDQFRLAQSKNEWLFVSRPALRFVYLGVNLRDRIMRDVDIRRAIHFALNKSEITGDDPDFSITNNLIPLSLLGSNSASSQDAYSVSAAKKALNRSPFFLRRPLKVSLWHATPSEDRRRLLARLAKCLKEVGIEVEIKIASSVKEMLEEIYTGQAQLFLYGEVIDFPDPDALVNRLFNSKSEGNLFAYRNAEVDQLLLKGQTSLSDGLRAPIYMQIEKQILEDHVIIPLFSAKYSFVTDKRVQGFEINPLGFQYLPLRKVWMGNRE